MIRFCKQTINDKGFLGHDALSHLVDVAVAQQALPVPNDNNRRQPSHIAVTSADGQSLQPPRDRFPPYLLPADVVALQQHHNQQVINLINFNYFLKY